MLGDGLCRSHRLTGETKRQTHRKTATLAACRFLLQTPQRRWPRRRHRLLLQQQRPHSPNLSRRPRSDLAGAKPSPKPGSPNSRPPRTRKRLTTSERSALDWNAHVHSSGAVELASELEANRRGCRYLEKVEFLQRVGDRKNEALEANRDHKRCRG